MKDTIIRYLLLLLLLSLFTYSSVNPFIIFNQDNIKHHQAFMPLPLEQILQAKLLSSNYYRLSSSNNIWITLKASQRLVIFPKEHNNSEITALVSLDGKLYEHKTLPLKVSDTGLHFYDLYNNFNQPIAIKLTNKEVVEISLITTFSISTLYKVKAQSIILPHGEKSIVVLHSQDISKRFDRFRLPTTTSLNLKGEGTLKIQIALPLKHGIETLQPQRERITFTHNHSVARDLESLHTSSYHYIDDVNHTKVTQIATHYIALNKGENNITLKTYGDVLLHVTLYHKHNINPVNDTTLLWKVPNTLSFINQALWKNSHPQDALKRMEKILKQRTFIKDNRQKIALMQAAYQGTSLQPLYPSHIPLHSYITHAYYAKQRLYTHQEINNLRLLSSMHSLSDLNLLQKGFFVDVPQSTTSNNSLTYHFNEPLKVETEIELTFLDKSSQEREIYLKSEGAKKVNPLRKFSLLYDTPTQNLLFSKGLYAYEHIPLDYSPIKRLALLKNHTPLPLEPQTATIRIVLKKGTRSISFSTQSNKTKLKLSVRMRKASTYRDTPYQLTHNFAGSYRRFAKSLYAKTPQNFNAWYEQTHPLRLWMQSRIKSSKKGLRYHKISNSSALNNAKKIYKEGDKYTALLIAKHFLFLSKDKHIQKDAYQLLLKLSENPTQMIQWHTVYFSLTQSPQVLKEIAIMLQAEGQFSLSMMAYLLLDKSSRSAQVVSDLAKVQNQLTLSHTLLPNSKNLLRKKSTILSEDIYQKSRSNKGFQVQSSAGKVQVYNRDRDLYLSYHRVTEKQPLQLEVQGPRTIELSMRFLKENSSYQWLRIEHNQTNYHYPLTAIKPSSSLSVKPTHEMISINNTLKLSFGKGKHILTLHAYEHPLTINISSYKIKEELSLPLDKQLLKTSDNSAKRLLSNIHPTIDTPYLSALLWLNNSNDELQRYEIGAKAWIIKANAHHNNYSHYQNSLLEILTQKTRFSSYPALESMYGFYDVPIPSWCPTSQIQKNRTPLLHKITSYDRVLTGIDYQTIHLQGEQNLTIEARQIFPDFLPVESLSFAITLDNQAEEIFHFEANQTLWQHTYALSEGEHYIKIRLVNPLSTHYLGLKFWTDTQHREQQMTQRFYDTSRENPIVLYIEGPKLLRIEEQDEKGKRTTYYHYLSNSKEYREKIYPSKTLNHSLIRIATMHIDPLAKPLRRVETQSILQRQDTPATQMDFSLHTFFTQNIQSKPIIQQLLPTWSLSIGSTTQELSSEDNPNASTKTIPEIALLRREKLDEDFYLRQHFFVRLYSNPLYGLKHKFSFKTPLDNIWSNIEVNAYQQKSKSLFKNLHLKAEVIKKESLGEDWRHYYTLGFNKYFLEYDNPDAEPLDPLVYSRYRKDHQQNGYFIYKLFYTPYDDLTYNMEIKFNSNETLNIIDNAKYKFRLKHLAYPYDFTLYYDGRYYFEDRDRPSDYMINRIGGNIKYNRFLDNNRLELGAKAVYKIENSDMQLSFKLIWHFSENKMYHNFMSSEKSFDNLRMLLEDQRGS